MEIKPIRFWSHKVLPLVYDESLSYYEFLCKVNDKLTEVINETNELSVLVNGIVNEYKSYIDGKINDAIVASNKYTDAMIADVNQDIATLKKYTDGLYETLTKNVNNRFDAMESDYNTKISSVVNEINSKYSYLIELIKSNEETIKEYINMKIADVLEYVKTFTAKDIKMYNPTSGKIESIDKVINDVYNYLRYCGVTATEYDSLNLTAQGFDSKYMSALDYDIYAKNLLMLDNNHYMYSPFNGEYVSIKSVVYDLALLHAESPITAQKYDALELTSDNYDSRNITAYDYDNKAQALLIA